MIWKFKPKPVYGDTRIVKKFLVFPIILNNELRWWDTYSFEQEYKKLNATFKFLIGRFDGWVNTKWVD